MRHSTLTRMLVKIYAHLDYNYERCLRYYKICRMNPTDIRDFKVNIALTFNVYKCGLLPLVISQTLTQYTYKTVTYKHIRTHTHTHTHSHYIYNIWTNLWYLNSRHSSSTRGFCWRCTTTRTPVNTAPLLETARRIGGIWGREHCCPISLIFFTLWTGRT